MDNQKMITYLVDMVKQIHETTISLVHGQESLDRKIDERCNALDQKIDERCNALDQKIDARCDAIDAKIDKYYEENRKEHFEMRKLLAHIQNDIKDLRTDIDTVYDLEKDSRKQLRKLF